MCACVCACVHERETGISMETTDLLCKNACPPTLQRHYGECSSVVSSYVLQIEAKIGPPFSNKELAEVQELLDCHKTLEQCADVPPH